MHQFHFKDRLLLDRRWSLHREPLPSSFVILGCTANICVPHRRKDFAINYEMCFRVRSSEFYVSLRFLLLPVCFEGILAQRIPSDVIYIEILEISSCIECATQQ